MSTSSPLFKIIPPSSPQRIHVTQRSTYRACRRYYKYVNQMGLIPKEDRPNALFFGIGMHHCLAHFYKGGDPVEEWCKWLTSPDAIVSSEQMLLGRDMLERYVEWVESGADDGWHIDGRVEMELTARIPGTDAELVGTIDLMPSINGKLWIVDHKNYQTFATTEALQFDDQMTSYLWLARENGYKVEGVIFNMLRKKIPATPYKVKDGSRLSVDRSIDTTYDIYLKAILDNGFSIEPYEALLNALKVNKFFHRERVFRTRHDLDSYGEMIQHEVREMTDPHTPMYPNFTQDCPRCEMGPLCLTETSRADTESVATALYKKVELRY